MDSQNTYDQGLNISQPQPGGAATMPLPSAAPAQPPAAASPWLTAGYSTPQIPAMQPITDSPQQLLPQAPVQAPPMSQMSEQSPVLQPTVPVHPIAPVDAVTFADHQPAGNQNGAAGLGDLPAEAADNDVIEKEWLVKAKQIVGENRHDPFKQVRELNRLKADYMKKRYNKELKLPDA